MKRILLLAMSLSLVFTLFACQSAQKSEDEKMAEEQPAEETMMKEDTEKEEMKLPEPEEKKPMKEEKVKETEMKMVEDDEAAGAEIVNLGKDSYVSGAYAVEGRFLVNTRGAADERIMTVARALCDKSLESDSPSKAEFGNVYFEFDKSNIEMKAAETLNELASWLSDHPNLKFYIEGHCDERGTNEYNLGLGNRRANSAKNFLVSAGISEDRIGTISCGEERPACDESSESCWWRNRRAHFVVVK